MKKEFDFVGHKMLFMYISLGLIAIGLLCNIIFGVELDISFKGGTLLKYSYSGDLDRAAVETLADEQLGSAADVQLTTNDVTGVNTLNISLTEAIPLEKQDAVKAALLAAYPNNTIAVVSTNSLEPSMGQQFFIKCLVAIALASIFLVIYVALRFRKIGGVSAGVMALVALLHDALIAYFAFVVFRIPLNDNFVAVMLAILGYSLNDTIVIYDRIRENRKIMEGKTSIAVVVNTSINQCFTRSINTSLCTFVAVGVVAVISLILGMSSIVSFAVPMMFGILSGCYSTTFLCTPLWVLWVEHTQKKEAEKKVLHKHAKKA